MPLLLQDQKLLTVKVTPSSTRDTCREMSYLNLIFTLSCDVTRYAFLGGSCNINIITFTLEVLVLLLS
jgi:hypothetical protein